MIALSVAESCMVFLFLSVAKASAPHHKFLQKSREGMNYKREVTSTLACLTCGAYNAEDCKSEYANAETSGNFTGFCGRCRDEGNANVLRSRCRLCCDQCNAHGCGAPSALDMNSGTSDGVISDFNSDVGLMISMVQDDRESWGYKIGDFINWKKRDITCQHCVLYTTFLRSDIYQDVFNGGSHGGYVARWEHGEQWKLMGLGRLSEKDHPFPSDKDYYWHNYSTCPVDPEEQPRPVQCVDRSYGEGWPQGDGSYDTDLQHQKWLEDVADMVKKEHSLPYPIWNELHAMGLSKESLAGIFYPVDGNHPGNTAWTDEYPSSEEGAWINHACAELKKQTGQSEWPVYQYTIQLAPDGTPEQSKPGDGEKGASQLENVGTVTC